MVRFTVAIAERLLGVGWLLSAWVRLGRGHELVVAGDDQVAVGGGEVRAAVADDAEVDRRARACAGDGVERHRFRCAWARRFRRRRQRRGPFRGCRRARSPARRIARCPSATSSDHKRLPLTIKVLPHDAQQMQRVGQLVGGPNRLARVGIERENAGVSAGATITRPRDTGTATGRDRSATDRRSPAANGSPLSRS